MQEVRGFATTTSALVEMADWFHCWGVTRVVMESTGDYWKGAYYLLEAAGFECWLVNARDVKNVPGRPKTDLLTELLGGMGIGSHPGGSDVVTVPACEYRGRFAA
jgi:hypothetical protein